MPVTFAVPSGPLQGAYDGVLVLTDLEADDAIALKVLAARLRGVPLLVVVGEGDADKTAFAAGLLGWLGLDSDAVVVQSRRSTTRFPAQLAHLYAEDTGQARVVPLPAAALPAGSEEAETAAERFAGEQIEAFLIELSHPLALFLKPPHEMLHVSSAAKVKTSAALYGSFNLSQLRDQHWPAGRKDALELEFLRSFGAVLWLERSAACGRDCNLDARSAPALWAASVAVDAKLELHIRHWNQAIVHRSCGDIGMGTEEVERLLQARDMDPAEVASRSAEGAWVERKLNKIILPNIRVDCMQACHADTLVVACLVDDHSKLAPFLRYTDPIRDAKGGIGLALAPKPEDGQSCPISTVVTAEGDERVAFVAASFAVLAAALPPPTGA